MGHQRLGSIPTTRKFRQVVAYIEGESRGVGGAALSDDVNNTARRALNATQAGLTAAKSDYGLRYSFYLLTQLVLAMRQSDWPRRLQLLGINVAHPATVFELCVQVQGVIDDHVRQFARHTDVSEMAMHAVGEALSSLAAPDAATLFGSGPDELQCAVRALSTKEGFARLGQKFFSQFVARYLNFFLSRATAANVGGRRIHQLGDLCEFNEALRLHCEQSALIVRDFCGDWYSKTEFKEGITIENTSRFMAVAMKKLSDELKRQSAGT
ncbi:MAG TPA: hypothetical protein VGP72_12150 [Planctomycetota bacterium]|jgi:hypothetical protein